MRKGIQRVPFLKLSYLLEDRHDLDILAAPFLLIAMHYVDGFVIAIPTKNLKAYKAMATTGGKVWRKHGALEYYECVMEDPKPKGVKLTYKKMLKLKPGETAVFSFIIYKSRKHRDEVNAKVMKDPMMNDPKYENMPMPFDMKRMAFAGFMPIVEA